MKYSPAYQLIIYIYYISFVSGRNWERKLHLRSVLPRAVIVLEGTPVTAYCGSSSPVNWTFFSFNTNIRGRHTSLHHKHLVGYKNITLVDLVERDSGLYYCHGTYLNSSFQKFIKVNVKSRMPRNQIVPSLIEVSIGSAVTLKCGSEKRVEWFGAHIQKQNRSIGRNSLTLYNMQKQHSGLYICRGYTNFIFHSSSTVFVGSLVERIFRLKTYSLNPNQMIDYYRMY